MTKAKVTFPSAPDTSAIDIEDEGSLIVSNPTVMNFTGPGVTVTENPTGTAEVDIPGLQYWTESEDATTQQSTIFTPNNSATDVNAVLLPKGNGANTAQTPDGTTAGGNGRGAYATDWQKERNSSAQVASGIGSAIPGGRRNTASGNYSFAMGNLSTASGLTSIAIGDGTNATNTHAVGLGRTNIASGQSSFACGHNNTPSGLRSATLGGFQSISSAYSAVTLGGERSYAYQEFMKATAGNNNFFTLAGGVQISELIICDQGPSGQDYTTGASNVIGALVPPDANRAYNVVASWTAVVIGISGTATGVNVGDYITQCNLFGFKRVAGTGSVTSITTVATHGDASMTGSASMAFTSVSNNLSAAFTGPTFAGGGTLEIRITIRLQLSEVAWT